MRIFFGYLLLAALWVGTPASSEGLASYMRATERTYPFKSIIFGNSFFDQIFQKNCIDLGGCSQAAKVDFYELFYGVREINYSFDQKIVQCPYLLDLCQDGIEWLGFEREIIFNIDSLRFDMVQSIKDLAYDGCDFLRIYVDDPHGTVTPNSFSLTGNYRGKQRVCDKLLGTHDTASTKGDFEFTLSLRVKGATTPFERNVEDIGERLSLTPSHRVFHQDSDFFGIFDTNTLLGRIVSRLLFVGTDVVAKLFNKDTFAARLRLLETIASDIDYTELTDQLTKQTVSLLDVPRTAPVVLPNGLAGFRYVLNEEKTQFVMIDGKLHLKVAQIAAVPDVISAGVYVPLLFSNEQLNSLKLIDSFSRKASFLSAIDGDSLESIALKEYGIAALSYYLAWKNNIPDPDYIRVGQRLQIVPFWMVLQDYKEHSLIGFGSSFYREMTKNGLSAQQAMAIIEAKELPDFVLPLSASPPDTND